MLIIISLALKNFQPLFLFRDEDNFKFLCDLLGTMGIDDGMKSSCINQIDNEESNNNNKSFTMCHRHGVSN
jgi:hypothetical protein